MAPANSMTVGADGRDRTDDVKELLVRTAGILQVRVPKAVACRTRQRKVMPQEKAARVRRVHFAEEDQQHWKRRAVEPVGLEAKPTIKPTEPAYIRIVDGIVSVASRGSDEEELLLKSAMAGTWTYGTNIFQLDLTDKGVLRFRQDVLRGGSKKTTLSWALQPSGGWHCCDLVAEDGSYHGSVQFRLNRSRTRMILRCRVSREDDYSFERKAYRVVA